jgi:hypothetical protein
MASVYTDAATTLIMSVYTTEAGPEAEQAAPPPGPTPAKETGPRKPRNRRTPMRIPPSHPRGLL